MANFDQLKQSVAALIRTNGAEEITGQIMQEVLLTIINSISGGYMFGGVAQHSGNVGNPDYNVFYLAGSGAYTGYGDAINIPNGCYGVFRYNGSWTQDVVDIGVHLTGTIREGETNGVTGDVINTALQQLFNNVMNILDTLTFTYNTPDAQKATKAMLDVIVTPTGGASHVLTTLTLVSATAAAAGLMSAEDKQKVDRMLTDFRSLSFSDTTAAADQATKIVQTLSATLGENPEAITTMTFLAATASKAGLMSAADKEKLDALWSSGYQYVGIATPSTTPISTTSKIFYIATEAGTYFNAVTVTQGINILSWNGTSWSAVQVIGIDDEPTQESNNLATSKGIYNKIAEQVENGNMAYSLIAGKYTQINDTWLPKVLKTNGLSVGDTVTDSNFEVSSNATGRHIIVDMNKYNTENTKFISAKYKATGSSSYHLFALLDTDFKVVYISPRSGTGNEYLENNFENLGSYRYVVFNNFFSYQGEPDIQVMLGDTNIVKTVEQNLTDGQKKTANKNLGLFSNDVVAPIGSYKDCFIDVETGELVESTGYSGTYVNMYGIEQGSDYTASGRTVNSSSFCSIAYYNDQREYIGHDKDGGGTVTGFLDYALTVPHNAAYVAVYGRKNSNYYPSLKKTYYFKDINFEAISEADSAEKLKGKTIAIIGDSIDTHGNTGPNKNAVEISISEEDVGVELSAYVTYNDVQAGLSLGGTTYTTSDIGTEVTFTPTAEDVGKVIGRPNNYNSNSLKVWWQFVQDYFGCDIIPVCWSGASITSHEGNTNAYKTSYAWHEAQIRKCGIRTPGTMTRTAPDVIIITRSLNDFTHEPFARITEGYFNTVTWQYPDSDIIQDNNFGLLEGIAITIKELREAYPFTPILLMDGIPCKRLSTYNQGNFPMSNGLNNQPQLNKAIKDAADFFGCQFIPLSKCAITWENMYPTYVNDSSIHPTHPNQKGHEILGKFAVDYLKGMNFTV